ncbi:MAG TPA: zinc ribbon domain-containing protein [bacterium]|nr:zinc ribbon domain-containing protein [bacterium]
MAYFDYYCDKCEKQFEIQAPISDDRKWVKCPDCEGKNVRRVYSSIVVPKKSSGSSGGSHGGGSCASCRTHNCGSCG